MKKTGLLIIIIIYAITVRAVKQDISSYSFLHITGEDRLSQSHVKSILQDSYGFMWFGTRNGLNRYDGTSMKTLNCNDYHTNKGNHNISALSEDSERTLWVGTDKGVFTYDHIYETFTSFDVLSDDSLRIENWIADIKPDSSGNVWIVVPNQGVFKYRLSDKRLFHYYITDPEKYKDDYPQCITVTRNGQVWIGSAGAGLFLYNDKDNKFIQYITDRNGSSLKGENVYAICEYGDNIAVAIHRGELRKFDRKENIFSRVDVPEVNYSIIRDIECYHDNELWVATQLGLFIINEKEKKVVHIEEDDMNPYSISDKNVYTLYRDRQEGIWLGTLFGGVNYLPDYRFKIEKYRPLSKGASLNTKRIGALAEDSFGNIWIGTEDAGINILNPVTGKVERLKPSDSNHLNILTLFADKRSVWAATFIKGLDVIDLPSRQVKHYTSQQLNSGDESVYALYRDSKDRIWLGNMMGLRYAGPGEMRFKMIEAPGYIWVYDIVEDPHGNIWAATMGMGVYRYDPENNTIKQYQHHDTDSSSLSSNSVSSITIDSRGRLWFSTDRGGICCYREESDDFISYSRKDGLPDDVAYKILEDPNHNLWFGTNKGLVRFNPETGKIRVYTKNDGLLGDQFNYKSALSTSNGKFYFGGIDGLIAFDPLQEHVTGFTPHVYITKFSVYNKELDCHAEGSPLKKSIIHTREITLPYNQANISIDFVAVSFSTSATTQYAYKIENIDMDWIYTNNNHNISYSQLPPGQYVFKVKAFDPDRTWKPAGTSLQITILPPWWTSHWAYTLYIILGLCVLAYWFFWYKKRQEKKIREQQKLFEVEKEKELYSAKVEFFTEIAHEVRTPLTLINGPLENIMEMGIEDPRIVRNLQVMEQNTKRLLDLTKQLLDFRKVGANKFLMNFVKADISELLRDTIARFEPTIVQQGKELDVKISAEPVFVDIDKEAVTKIISNLLNNALKYAVHKIIVSLRKDATSFTVIVSSDGEKIPKDLSQQIFEPFYQINNKKNTTSGAGIGLPLSRSLAELHTGQLFLDTGAEMNSFVLILPLNQEKVMDIGELPVQGEYIRADEKEEVIQTTDYIILLVEDNEQMLSFVSEKLKEHFVVETALNGEEALEIMKDRPVDIVITDVMMPVMNGMQLCRAIKTNVEYNHIPVIFLTAKNDLDSKIKGLEMGADAYIEKPFSFNYLEVQVITLLNNRRKEREAFSRKPFFPVHNMHMNKTDEEFLNKIILIIQKNITDDNFNVEHLAEILGMSRSSLLRKIKVLTTLSPVDFIKVIRLKRAAELIAGGEYRIGEICYMVGINSPSYFSKLFFKQFGVTPKDFEKNNNTSSSGK